MDSERTRLLYGAIKVKVTMTASLCHCAFRVVMSCDRVVADVIYPRSSSGVLLLNASVQESVDIFLRHRAEVDRSLLSTVLVCWWWYMGPLLRW